MAHECIQDLRPLKEATGISEIDIAKRLIDYGFHAHTMSFPVAGTPMVEPIESESLLELDRFIEAMLAIRAEIQQVADGIWPADDNPLMNAPHTQRELAGEWRHPYDRQVAAFSARYSDKILAGGEAVGRCLWRPQSVLLLRIHRRLCLSVTARRRRAPRANLPA